METLAPSFVHRSDRRSPRAWRVRSALLVVVAVGMLLTGGAMAAADLPRRDILGLEEKVHSQGDEEVIIRDFFQDRRGGVFLDVGSGPPLKNSTTYYLERNLGWTGIGLDALPEYADDYAARRPGTRFRNFIVTDHGGTTESFYWVLGVPGLSSTDPARKWGGKELKTERIDVPTTTLDALLEAEGILRIDFLSMDIEGGAPKALAGFDIERFRPALVCIESSVPEVRQYFADHGYEPIERYFDHDPVNTYYRRVVDRDPTGSSMLWRVRHPEYSDAAPVHLLASHPLAKHRRLRFDASVMEAFAAADELVLGNTSVQPGQVGRLGRAGSLPKGERLADRISPELHARIGEALDALGIASADWQRRMPWYAAVSLDARHRRATDFANARELAIYFHHLATVSNPPKRIRHLERSEVTYVRLAARSGEDQVAMLGVALDALEAGPAALSQSETAWLAGDVEALQAAWRDAAVAGLEALTSGDDPERLARVILASVESNDSKAFFVAHARAVMGEAGVLDRLRAAGMRVEAVESSGGQGPLGVESQWGAPIALAKPRAQAAGEDRPRVLIVGIDGAMKRMILRMTRQGRLPTFERLLHEGASGGVLSDGPAVAPRFWNTVATGRFAEDHGIDGLVCPGPGQEAHPCLASDRTADPLWEIVERSGRTVGVVNWWNTYPVAGVDGVIVSDRVRPYRAPWRPGYEREPVGLDRRATAHPERWVDRAEGLYRAPAPITGADDPFLGVLGIPRWMQREELSWRFRDDGVTVQVARAVEEAVSPDLSMVFLPGLDRVSHRLWASTEPADAYEEVLPRRARTAARAALHQYYAYVDELLGLLIEPYGPDDLILVVSGHGFEPGGKLRRLNGVHRDVETTRGILFARGPGIEPGRKRVRVRAEDLVPTVLTWLRVPVPEDLPGRVATLQSAD